MPQDLDRTNGGGESLNSDDENKSPTKQRPGKRARTGHIYEDISLRDSARFHAGDTYQTFNYSTLSREQQCHQVFKTSSYEAYKDRNPNRVEGTCGWALKHPQFQTWRNGDQQCLLWISADPGCGKSVLSKSLADRDLREGGQETICYFFFKDNNEQDNLATALCALLHQLFAQQPDLIGYAIPAWESNGERLQSECKELWRILRSAMADQSAQPVICVLDALDECRDDDRRQLIELLCDLQAQVIKATSGPKLKFVVTSRPYENVQRWFDEATRRWPQIRIRGEDENEQVHQEINLVIKKRVGELAHKFALSETSRMQLQDQLLQMHHRTYLWLHLAIEEVRLLYANSLYPDEVVIPSVPSSVEDAYERLLQKITTAQREAARQVLLIIVGARRPLTITEMASALGAARTCRDGSNVIRPPNEQHLQTQIRQWCGLFVFIQHTKLFLVHQTAKEFLLTETPASTISTVTWRSTFIVPNVEKEMANICTTYLLTTLKDTKSNNAVTENSGFWQYCVEFWASHAQGEDVFSDSDLLTNALALSNVGGKAFSWFAVMWKASNPYKKVPVLLDQHVIAINGHTKVFEELYEQQRINIDAQDSTGATALVRAAQEGHLSMTRILLQKGADMNVQGHSGGALQEASLRGHEQIVRLLLQAGADVNARGGIYGSALQAASLKVHEQVIRILLKAGADVNAQGGIYGNALQAASFGGHEQLVQVLLKAGANVNAQGGAYSSALQAASFGGHEQLVQILLKAGANVNAQGGAYSSALQAASFEGNEQIVRLLLQAGADVNAQGGIYGNALQAASLKGHEQLIQVLLTEGADVNAQGNSNYGNALQAASFEGNEQIVRLLLQAGADVNAQGGIYGSALQAASLKGHEQLIQVLLKAGANVNAQGGAYVSALQAASFEGNEQIVRLLLQAGADVNAQGDKHGNALQAATTKGHGQIVQILRTAGAVAS